jgi:teichuronic acid biosynthesis glycosyltransferase TuaH
MLTRRRRGVMRDDSVAALNPRTPVSCDVVFTFSTETWADGQHRGMARPPDRLLETLMASERVRSVLVANPYRSAPIRLLRAVTNHRESFPTSSCQALVSPLRLRRRDPVRARHVERTYRAYDRRLARASLRLGQASPAVITTNPLAAGFSPFEWTRSVTFFARDDWSSFPPMRPWWPAIRLAFERIRDRGVRVCAVSEPILAQIAPTGQSLVVPNGIDPDEWLTRVPPPDWFAALPRPRLLYVGTLDDRLDVAAVRRLLEAFPNASLVLLGPVTDRQLLRELLDHDRVHLWKASSRLEVTAVTMASDVGLLPHRHTDLTRAMSPLKLYEYLAGGLPVASTDLPPIRAAAAAEPGRVVLVNRRGDFPAAVREALVRGRQAEPERRAFIEQNAWTRRHAAILDLALGHI